MDTPERRTRWSRRTTFALLVPAVLVAGWLAVTGAIRAHVDGLVQHAVGRPLPAFRLVDRAGRAWSDGDLLGRLAVLHFFRSRCHACELEAPELHALERSLPKDTVLLHVMTDAVLDFEPEVTAATLSRSAYAAPVLMADTAFVDAFHKVAWSNVTPITYVVDARGTVRYGLRGTQTRAAIEQALSVCR
jgi:peroxiredoxin